MVIGLCAVVAVGSIALSTAWPPGERNGPCAALDLYEGRLERAEPVGYPNGMAAATWLCLAYEPEADIYAVDLTPVYTPEQFRAAKVLAASRLQATGFDPCRVTWWADPAARGAQGLDDLLDNPVAYPPRLIAADHGAEQWLPDVGAAVARAAEASSRDFDWHPTRPLTILVGTDAEAVAAAYRRYGPTGPPEAAAQWAQTAERQARSGTSVFQAFSATGSLILINLSVLSSQDPNGLVLPASINTLVLHEYTHFVQRSLLGNGQAPAWFVEGQAVYQQHHVAGTEDLVQAARARRTGKASRLTNLVQFPQDSTHEPGDFDGDGIYVRGYAGVAFLVAHHGFAATTRLLRDNRDGSLAHFQELLSRLTSMGTNELDDAVDAWLVAPGTVLLSDDFSTPNSRWPFWANTKDRHSYDDHEYVVDKLAASGAAAVAFLVAQLGDFDAEVDVQVRGTSTGTILRFEIRLPGYGGYYKYAVDLTEHAITLQRSTGGEWVTVLDNTQEPGFRDAGSVNRLGIHATESEIILRANGEELARVTAEPAEPWLDMGLLTLSVDQRDDGEAEARFSRLVVANAP